MKVKIISFKKTGKYYDENEVEISNDIPGYHVTHHLVQNNLLSHPSMYNMIKSTEDVYDPSSNWFPPRLYKPSDRYKYLGGN